MNISTRLVVAGAIAATLVSSTAHAVALKPKPVTVVMVSATRTKSAAPKHLQMAVSGIYDNHAHVTITGSAELCNGTWNGARYEDHVWLFPWPMHSDKQAGTCTVELDVFQLPNRRLAFYYDASSETWTAPAVR